MRGSTPNAARQRWHHSVVHAEPPHANRLNTTPLRPGPRWRPTLALATAVIALHAAALLVVMEQAPEPLPTAPAATAPGQTANATPAPARAVLPAVRPPSTPVQTRRVLAPDSETPAAAAAAPPPAAATQPTARPPADATAAPAAARATAQTAAAAAVAAADATATAVPSAARPATAVAPTLTAAVTPLTDGRDGTEGTDGTAAPIRRQPPPAVATAPLPKATLLAAPSVAAPAAAAPVAPMPHAAITPVYTTRIPPPVLLSYELRRGPLSGRGSLRWQSGPEGYSAVLQARVLSLKAIDQTSNGRIDGAGIAPERFVDRRRGRSAMAANFQRGPGLISFSGPGHTFPLRPGTQDRLSWMLQLPAIVAADAARQAIGAETVLYVVGARGDAEVWTFVVRSRDALTLPSGAVAEALHLQRASRPGQLHETQVDIWLDPARHHLPVQVHTRSNDDEAVELRLVGLQTL